MDLNELSEFEEAGAEYRFLLQPVRDLASNWDIDISNYLEEYVRKLIGESETTNFINEHGRRKIFNFAEAAVLIHGSTNIYVKKVEYVYQLAANFFDQLKEDKQKKRRKEHGEDGPDEGGESDDDAENNVYKNPYLHPDKRKSRLECMKNVLLKLSKKRPCLPLVPIGFTPLADFEKSDVPLYSRLDAKEVIGKKDDFKINICHIHEAVALLDLKNAELIDKFTCFNDENQPEYGGPTFREPKQEFSTVEAHRDATDGFEDYGHADISVSLGALVESSEVRHSLFNVPEDIASVDNAQPKFSSMGFVGHTEDEDFPMLDQTDIAIEAAVVEEDEFLDPFEEKSEKSKPFKVSKKCCTVAAKQVKMRDYRIAKECLAKGVPDIPSVKNYIDSRMYRRKIKKRSYAFSQFNSFLMDQAILALNASIYEEEKRRAEIKKKREAEAKNALRAARKSQRQSRRNPTASIDFVTRNTGESAHDPYFEDAADELGADEIIEDNEPEQPQEFHQLGDYLHVDDLEDSLRVANLYADGSDNFRGNLDRAHFSSFGYATQNIYDDTIMPDVAYPDELPPRPVSQMEYDELVAYHLRKYWSTAEEATSKFCERVQKWEEKMTPLLEKEYQHREFDTRQYGDELMEAFQNKLGTTIDFRAVVKHSLDYEMSRYLLVSLIMANTQNVQVLNASEHEMYGGCTNSLQLKLLKLERHHEVFEEEQLLVSGKNIV